MDKKPLDHTFTFKDDLSVTETFVDGVHLISADQSTFRISFTVSRTEMPKGSNKQPTGQKVVACRLVMPIGGLAELYNQLDRAVRGMEASGLLKREIGGGMKPTMQ